MQNPDLVLVVGDMFVPQRASDINEQFKSILTPNKVQHVLCLGNIGSHESYDWLKSLSNDYQCVKGNFDEDELPDKKLIQIGEFKIGMIHGHQILPWGDLESLANIQRELGCDILISGHTHHSDVKVKENRLFINPGSISGAFSPSIDDPNPSFILMVLTGEEVILYLYSLNDKTKKFDVNKLEYTKGAADFRIAKEEDEVAEETKKEEEEEKVESSEPQAVEQEQVQDEPAKV